MPKVSVIIPVYNQYEYLAEAIESVVAQTYSDWEIVVVDDGSRPDAAEAIRRICSEGRVTLIVQENQGLPWARNTGLLTAQGEYIAFLDADDIFLP